MAEGIFLNTASGLTLLPETAYDSEAVLQEVLAEYPDVIAGVTTEGDHDARLLLITREMPVGGYLSLDHLFLDDTGVPVLVEVKRSSDTRIRREVVGQLLDYAANAARYWPIARLQDYLDQRATVRADGRTGLDLLTAHIGDSDPEEFWTKVETNLKRGRIRLLFVADNLPDELVRVITFLNEQMNPAEVLGVELRQYTADGHTAYVPHVLGRTATAVDTKTTAAGGTRWEHDSFFDAARERCDDDTLGLVEAIHDHVGTHGSRISWGRGVTPGFGAWYVVDGAARGIWSVNVNDERAHTRPYLQFYLRDVAANGGAERIEAAARLLKIIPTMRAKLDAARSDGWRRYPSLYLTDVITPEHRAALFAAIDILAGRAPAGTASGPSAVDAVNGRVSEPDMGGEL